jgi:hypothetical protein
MTKLDVPTIRDRIDLSPRFTEWLDRFVTPTVSRGLSLPDDSDAKQVLERLGVDEIDRAACLAARPDPGLHPEHWWIGGRVYLDLLAKMGCSPATDGYMGWPGLLASVGPVGRYLYVWVFLAALPDVRHFHLERGIPDDVSWQTLAQLGGELAQRRRVHRIGGLMATWTQPLVFRGATYRLGRHVFDRGRGGLNVHVPEGESLDPEASLASFDRARRFFPRHFPEEPITEFGCHSWLLDDQWARYLSDDSNIIRFQQRFTLVEEQAPELADLDILELVFHRALDRGETLLEVLDELPQTTTLQRAYVAHLRGGEHWLTRTGVFPV